MVLNLIGFGSVLTIFAIFAITAPALDLSYVAVILARNIYSKSLPFQPGPYTLGKWQKPVNAIACTWVFFISVILMFPTMLPITAANMNYAIAVAAGIAFFALTWWYAGARKRYFGPKTQNLLLLSSDCDEEQRLAGGNEREGVDTSRS
jgi:amino acid transporter